MPREILDEFQSSHFNTSTLSLTKANWVEKWSKLEEISFIGPTMWVSSTRYRKTQFGARVMVFNKVQ